MTSRREPGKWRNGRLGWAALGLALLAWEMLGRLSSLPASTLPTPSRIVLEAARESTRLAAHGATTTYEASVGLALGTAGGWLAALGVSALVEPGPRMPAALAAVGRVPLLALAPILSIWCGAGLRPKIVLAALAGLVPVALETARGLAVLEAKMRDLSRCVGAGPVDLMRKIRIPSSLPFLFRGARQAAVATVAAAAVAEFVAGDHGLGYLVMAAGTKLEAPLAIAAFAVLTALSAALHLIVALVERAVAPWASARPR